jgi:heme-degrading monooxygenase HmoA
MGCGTSSFAEEDYIPGYKEQTKTVNARTTTRRRADDMFEIPGYKEIDRYKTRNNGNS